MGISKRPKLNKIEEKIWIGILEFSLDNFRMPTREELAEKISDKNIKYSAQLVRYWLRSLEKKGYIEIIPFKKGEIVIK